MNYVVEFRLLWGEWEMSVCRSKAEKVKINYLGNGKDEQRAFVEIWVRILGKMQL